MIGAWGAVADVGRCVGVAVEVRERTRDLERALDLLNASNGALAEANRATEEARRKAGIVSEGTSGPLADALKDLLKK